MNQRAATSPAANTRARPLTARAQDRRDDIVRHARELFARDGYAATRMSDIATVAGVTKGLLYWYFDSKDELIAEILRDTRRRLRDEQTAALVDVDDVLERLYLATVAATCFIITNYRLYRIGGDGLQSLSLVLGESTRVHARDTAATLEEGQRQGLVRTNDAPLAMAYANAGVVNQICASAYYGRLKGSVEDIGHIAARHVLRACAADPSLVVAIEATYAPPLTTPRSNGARKPRNKKNGSAT